MGRYIKAYDTCYTISNNRWHRFWRPLGNSSFLRSRWKGYSQSIINYLGADDSDSITDAFCDAKKDLFGDIKDYQEHGGMKGMGESLDRGHVMVFSLWDDVEVNMLWLDSAYPLNKPETDPGIKRGDFLEE